MRTQSKASLSELLTENILENDLVLLPHDAERVPARLASRYRVSLHPVAAGITIEVITRVHRVVNGSDDVTGDGNADLRGAQSV